MATSLEKGKRLRSCAKIRLTRASNKVAQLTQAASQIEVSETIKAFETKLQVYDEFQNVVESFTEAEDLDAETQSAETYRDEKLLPLPKARELLAKKILTRQLQAQLLRLEPSVLTRGKFAENFSLPVAGSSVRHADVVKGAHTVSHGVFAENISLPVTESSVRHAEDTLSRVIRASWMRRWSRR